MWSYRDITYILFHEIDYIVFSFTKKIAIRNCKRFAARFTFSTLMVLLLMTGFSFSEKISNQISFSPAYARVELCGTCCNQRKATCYIGGRDLQKKRISLARGHAHELSRIFVSYFPFKDDSL